VTPPRTAERPLVQAFRDWLLAEAAGMQIPAPGKRRRDRDPLMNAGMPV
jgi:hypothetical protein